MSDKKQQEAFEFQLKVVYVKMKIKFPCKMTLQYNKQSITKEATSTEQNKFFFNESIVLRGGDDGYAFEILASLSTEKGTKYTSGSMKLLTAELRRSKGERLVIPLTKCLDPEAFCEIMVEGVVDLKDSQLKISRSSSKVINSNDRQDVASPVAKKINSQRFLIAETRSQANFQPNFNLGSEDKARETGPKSQVFKTFTKSPNSKFSNIKYATSNGNLLGAGLRSQFPIEEGTSQRTSFDQGEVYRQGYLKLKQKYKRESELLKQETRRRVTLQTNENNFKLQIMKMRVKAEEQEKQISEKSQRIKHISGQLSELQKKDLDLAYIREECNSLERKNKIQEETIVSLTNDIQSIKKIMNEKAKIDQGTIVGLRQELELAKNKVDQLKYEYQLQNRAKDNIILTKNNDIQLRNSTIERQKQLIKDLQEQAEAKLFEFQKTLNAERAAYQLKIDDQKLKVSTAQTEKTGLQQKCTLFEIEIQRLNSSITALEFNKKILIEETASAANEIVELKTTREKYNELVKEHRFLEEQFATVRKNLEATLQNKEVDLGALLKQYDDGRTRNEKVKGEQDEKIKALSAKILELELNANTNKNLLEKAKRTNQNLSKENASLRQQNRQIRQDLKNVQRRLIGIQSEYSSFSSRNQREIHNLKQLLEKSKEERVSDQKEIQQLKERCQGLAESVKGYEEKESQWRLKQRHYEERIEKEGNKFKEANAKYESIVKSQQQIINEHQSSFESINNQNRALRRKINDLELAAIRDRQSSEKLKKDLKLAEEKYATLDSNLKQRTQQERQYQQKIAFLEQRNNQKDHQFTKLRQKMAEEGSKAKKQDHIVDLLNKQVEKLQKINAELTSIVKSRDLSEEKLRQELKSQKEEVVKQKIKTSKVENDFQRFKESISDIIRIQFTRILNTPSTTQKNTQRLRESQVSNPKSQRSHKSKATLDAASLSSNLVQKLHETKNSLWKMAELNRILKQQNSKLMTHTENQSNKYQFAQLQLHRDIQLLEEQMNNIMNDKEIECQNYDQLVLDLNFRLKEKEAEAEDLRSEIAEYEAIVNGLKTDFQVNNDLNDKKVAAQKQTLSQLNERIEYLNLNVACLQDKNHELEQKTIQQQSQIISHKEMLIKHEKSVLDLRQSQLKLSQTLQSLKKEVKTRQELYVQLQMQLNSEKQSKEKYMGMLEEQEKKCQKLNEFVNGLILQKETAIKNQLEKTEENNQLENQLFELTHSKDLLLEENQTLKKKLEELKDESKSQGKTIKGLEKQLAQEKAKGARSIEKVKERQSDLQIKREYIKDLEEKYRQLRDKNYKEIRQLSNQLQDKNLIALNASKQLNEKIIKVETQSKKRWEEALLLQAEVQRLTGQLYAERDRNEDHTSEISRLKDEKASLEEEIATREFALHEREDQLNRLQELIAQLRLQIRSLESQCSAQEKEFNHHIEELANDYHYKLEASAKESAHNLQLLQEENKLLKEKSEGIEEVLAKTLLESQVHSSEHEHKIASYQEKLKKIEAERLNTVLAKNNEIKRISEESKAHNQKLREKQAQVRKLALQLQQKKTIEVDLQAKVSQLTEQAKYKEKLLEKEIECLKLKDKQANENRQKFITSLHENQQQIRKLLSQSLQKIVENCCKADSEKVRISLKALESSISQTMTAKLPKQ